MVMYYLLGFGISYLSSCFILHHHLVLGLLSLWRLNIFNTFSYVRFRLNGEFFVSDLLESMIISVTARVSMYDSHIFVLVDVFHY